MTSRKNCIFESSHLFSLYVDIYTSMPIRTYSLNYLGFSLDIATVLRVLTVEPDRVNIYYDRVKLTEQWFYLLDYQII